MQKEDARTSGSDKKALTQLLRNPALSKCAKEYLTALADPIGAEEGCLPSGLISLPSRKIKVASRGTFVASGTNGNGFILLQPGFLVANDASPVTRTSSDFAGSTFTTTAGIGVIKEQSNSEYPASSFNSTDLQWRLVSAALEVECTTPWSARGGSIAGICTQDHQSLNAQDVSQLLEYDAAWNEAISSGGSSKWCVKYNGPTIPGDLEYNSQVSGADASSGNACMGIFVSGVNSASFIYRAVAHFEVIGRNVRGKTTVIPDVQGAAIANMAMASAAKMSGRQNHNSNSWWESLGKHIKSGIRETMPYVKTAVKEYGPTAVKAAYAAGSAYYGNPAPAADLFASSFRQRKITAKKPKKAKAIAK